MAAGLTLAKAPATPPVIVVASLPGWLGALGAAQQEASVPGQLVDDLISVSAPKAAG